LSVFAGPETIGTWRNDAHPRPGLQGRTV